jgi:molybdopterin-guanine dinucleotide biosynthesis protein A
MIVLAGGAGRRLGGADKPGLVIGGRSLLESVLAAGAAAGATRAVVVGPPRDGIGAVFVREEPAGSGPVAALRRGIAEVTEEWVAVLAADLPFLRGADLRRLRESANDAGAILTDATGREQWLAGVWRTAVLREGLHSYAGQSLGGLFGLLEPVLVPPEPGERQAWLDCDTPGDLERVRRLGLDRVGPTEQ